MKSLLLLLLGLVVRGGVESPAAAGDGVGVGAVVLAAPQERFLPNGRWVGFTAREDTTEVVLLAVRFADPAWTVEGILCFGGNVDGTRSQEDANEARRPERIRLGRAWPIPSGGLYVSFAAGSLVFCGEYRESAVEGPQFCGRWQEGAVRGVWALAPEEDLSRRIPGWLGLPAAPGWGAE